MASDDRPSRAEARRRARLAARGELPQPELADAELETEQPSGGFLRRMFPPAPPLPNRPDPLAGYQGGGPLGFFTERIHLLRLNVLAWVLPGLGAVFGYFSSLYFGPQTVIGLFGTFILFGALIAAGWFGWQRPTLFGTTAALLGYFIAVSVVLFSYAQQGAGPQAFGVAGIVDLFLQALYMSGLGFLGGWYGGYLRRRQSQLGGNQRTRGSGRRR
jgi:hypothetical protein